MSNSLLNIDEANYDVITANSAQIIDLETNAISAITGNNVALNSNLIIGSAYTVTGNTLGIHIGDMIGNVTGNLTGNVLGNVVGNLTGNVTGTANGFTRPLSGDVTGTQTAMIVSHVVNLATTATTASLPNTIALRDASSNLIATSVSANLSGDMNGPYNATQITAGAIVNADINASAAIADTKLATIATSGKVSNSATTATLANTANVIVSRDSNGDSILRRALLTSASFGVQSGYGSIYMNGGNSAGGVYLAYTAFGDGIHLGYNYSPYNSSDRQTPTILNTGGAATRISCAYQTVTVACFSGTNVALDSTQNRLQISP